MIDSHCHFDLPAFDDQREHILANAKNKGVAKLLIPGLSLTQFSQLIALKKQFACLDIALGCHPYFLQPLAEHELAQQMALMGDVASQHINDIVAIGECGLDGSLPLPLSYQLRVLEQQIEIAKSVRKPLILHHRQSHNELIRALKQARFEYGGVVHAFSGSEQTAKTYIELGFALGVGGTISYERALKTRRTLKDIAMEHLLLETDAPDMPLFGFQGQINTPERLPLVCEALAALKNISTEAVALQTTANYERIFYAKHQQG